MNVWGKVLAFLVAVAAVFASILTAKLVQVRNSWTANALAAKTKFEDLKPKIASLEAQIDSLKNEGFRSRDLWGIFPLSIPTTAKPDGTVEIAAGSDQGIRPNMLLHGFELDANGASIYRGSFLPVDIQVNNATLKPNWRVSPSEARTWVSGTWRWRNLIPPGYQENFDKQLTALLKLEETLSDRLRTLAGQKELLAEANAKLKLREAELVGGDELSDAQSVDPEFREGLVAAISRAEEERNQILLKNDESRREVRRIQADIELLLDDIKELTNRLPQPASKSEITQKK